MKTKSIKISVLCAACTMVASAWAQTGSQSDPTSSSSSSSSQHSLGASDSSSSRLSSTGRTSEQAIRASKLMGAEVKGSSGSSIGRIEDVIINPTSGRIDFAVISRSGMGASSSPSGSSYGSSSAGGSQTSARSSTSTSNDTYGAESTSVGVSSGMSGGGKLIPLPWSLLQATSGSSGAGTSSGMTGGQPSFTLTVTESKLDQAPSLTRGSWSEISEIGWSQRVNSFFGVSDSSATGGAESPSGSSMGGSNRSGSDESPGTSGSSGSSTSESSSGSGLGTDSSGSKR